MGLFVHGPVKLRSGRDSFYKIECDAVTPEDWECLAAMAASILPPFRTVLGVPKGGFPFESALARYGKPANKSLPVLIAEDVITTGGSMERYRAKLIADGWDDCEFVGVAAFSRGPTPDWVTVLFPANPKLHDK